MHRFFRHIRHVIITFSAALLLSGCVAATALMGELPLYEEESNITAPSHTAADIVAQQLKARMQGGMPIIIQDFWNNHAPQNMTPLGRVLPEKISTRLIQLGYQIIQPRFAQQKITTLDSHNSPEMFLAGQQLNPQRLAQYTDGPHVILSGSYTKSTDHVMVHVRMTDSTSGIFVAAYDYKLPITREIEELMGIKR